MVANDGEKKKRKEEISVGSNDFRPEIDIDITSFNKPKVSYSCSPYSRYKSYGTKLVTAEKRYICFLSLSTHSNTYSILTYVDSSAISQTVQSIF